MIVHPSFLARLAVVGLAAFSLEACASRPKPMGPVATANPAPQAPPAPDRNGDRGMVSETPLDANGGPGSAHDFVIHAGDLVYFDFDRFEVRSEARAVLDTQAAWLARYPAVRVRVEGNTDERGTREYNFALGARRAGAVRDYLVERGVSGDRVETVSYGKEHPLSTDQGDKADALNRNAHTVVASGAR